VPINLKKTNINWFCWVGLFILKFSRKRSLKFCIFVANISRKTKDKTFVPTLVPAYVRRVHYKESFSLHRNFHYSSSTVSSIGLATVFKCKLCTVPVLVCLCNKTLQIGSRVEERNGVMHQKYILKNNFYSYRFY
jgi:hypothetical protein